MPLNFISITLSAAVLKHSDSLGLGMVNDGTKCGDKKVFSHKIEVLRDREL